MENCPRIKECANANTKCHICRNFSCFKTGASRGKGDFSEKKLAKKIGAKQRAGSGASPMAKGDIISATTLREVKSGYGSKSMSIQRSWLIKIQGEALAEGRLPVLDIHFDGAPDNEFWSVINTQTLQDLLEELERLRSQ